MPKCDGLHEADVTRYVLNMGTRCPFCGSDQIVADATDFESSRIFRAIDCHNCEARWEEEYMLYSISQVIDFPNQERITEIKAEEAEQDGRNL